YRRADCLGRIRRFWYSTRGTPAVRGREAAGFCTSALLYKPMHDLAIVGGGPGGLYAARQLARAGFGVAVFEEHPSAGDPVHCTGVLALEAFDEFDIPRSAILN